MMFSAVIDGNTPPINPQDTDGLVMYMYHNILFTPTTDVHAAGTVWANSQHCSYLLTQEDVVGYKQASLDLQGIRIIQSLVSI